MDVGALCLSSCAYSLPREDKHKAPTQPLRHPLSLLKSLWRETADVIDRSSLQSQLHQRLTNPGRVFITRTAPSDANSDIWKPGQGTQDKVIIGHEVIETLINVSHINCFGVP